MSGKTTTELEKIRESIQSEINKLNKVKENLAGDLRGLGGERCVSSIDLAIKEYKKSLKWLEKLTTVAKKMDGESSESSKGYGGSGSSGGGYGGGGGGSHGF